MGGRSSGNRYNHLYNHLGRQPCVGIERHNTVNAKDRPESADSGRSADRANALQNLRAVPTNILHFPARVVVTERRPVSRRRTTFHILEELSGASERPMIIPHDDHWAASAALRPPASRSRPRHRGRDHRHGSRNPSLDGPWLAWQGTQDRGEPGRDGPERIGTPARNPAATATREEAHGTPGSPSPC
jgi:hypothetical protein